MSNDPQALHARAKRLMPVEKRTSISLSVADPACADTLSH